MNDHFTILTTSHSWQATPWNYSSMRFLQFLPTGQATLMYGYGQTIYAKIQATFSLANDQMLIQYQPSPPWQRFAGFTPTEAESSKTITYTLKEQSSLITESVVNRSTTFQWILTCSESPFPDSLHFPYDLPLEFYGHESPLLDSN